MDLRQLEAFVAVCEERSFTVAAKRCNIAQSALSGRIADLEEGVGSKLFDRSVRPIDVTHAGEVLLRHARVILRQLDAATAEVKQLDGMLTGKLRLGMIEVASLSAPQVEQALAIFHSLHPHVEFVINDPSSRGIVEGMQRDQFDIGFVGYRRSHVPPNFVHHVLADREVVAVVATTHPLARHSSASLRQLADLGPSVELRHGTGLRLEADVAFTRAGVARSIGVEVATTDEAVRYAACGLGYTLVPDSALTRRQPGSSIAVLKLQGETVRHPVALIHPRPVPTSPAAAELLSVLRSTLPRATAGASEQPPASSS